MIGTALKLTRHSRARAYLIVELISEAIDCVQQAGARVHDDDAFAGEFCERTTKHSRNDARRPRAAATQDSMAVCHAKLYTVPARISAASSKPTAPPPMTVM